jgi:hypothetical protein
MTNEQIRKVMYRIYGADNVRKLIVAHRNGKVWVAVHLSPAKSDEILKSNEDENKLWRRFGTAYQNRCHQYGSPKRISFSLNPNSPSMNRVRRPVISVDFYMPERMAQVRHGKEVIFLGNTWDFHPGCHGTTFPLERLDTTVEIENFCSAGDLAQQIAAAVSGTVRVNHLKRRIPC